MIIDFNSPEFQEIKAKGYQFRADHLKYCWKFTVLCSEDEHWWAFSITDEIMNTHEGQLRFQQEIGKALFKLGTNLAAAERRRKAAAKEGVPE